MNDIFFKVSAVEKKMDGNTKMQSIMKVIAMMSVFVVFFCSINSADITKIALFILIPVTIVLFFLDTNYAKKNKELEFEMYLLMLDDYKKKKSEAESKGEEVPAAVLNRDLTPPSQDVKQPIVFYLVMLVLDFIIGMLIIG